jgi:hypothetical protein
VLTYTISRRNPKRETKWENKGNEEINALVSNQMVAMLKVENANGSE